VNRFRPTLRKTLRPTRQTNRPDVLRMLCQHLDLGSNKSAAVR
jgi:hypothetical protein